MKNLLHSLNPKNWSVFKKSNSYSLKPLIPVVGITSLIGAPNKFNDWSFIKLKK